MLSDDRRNVALRHSTFFSDGVTFAHTRRKGVHMVHERGLRFHRLRVVSEWVNDVTEDL